MTPPDTSLTVAGSSNALTKDSMGRPKFKTAEELQEKIDEYFNGGMHKRVMTVNDNGRKRKEELPIPTISGLCYYLGFESRQSFYDMGHKRDESFAYVVKMARLRIEREYEEMLQTVSCTGAIFALKNFDWKDTPAIDNSINIRKTFVYLDPKALKEQEAGNDRIASELPSEQV